MDHFYKNIGCGWVDGLIEVYADAVADAPSDRPSVFVELGAWMGRSTAFMAVEIINSGKPIAFHVVDHWKGDPDDATQRDFLRDKGTPEARRRFNENLADVMHVLTIHDQGSPAAAGAFANDSIDFCYIDGAHGYDAVKMDVSVWLPKVKLGGILAGHDYDYEGVRKAVDEMVARGGVAVVGKPWGKSWKVRKQ